MAESPRRTTWRCSARPSKNAVMQARAPNGAGAGHVAVAFLKAVRNCHNAVASAAYAAVLGMRSTLTSVIIAALCPAAEV